VEYEADLTRPRSGDRKPPPLLRETIELDDGWQAWTDGVLAETRDTIGDSIHDEAAVSTEDAATDRLMWQQVRAVLDALPPRQGRVVALRFGLHDGRARTLEEVALELDVPRQRVRTIEEQAFRRLRQPARLLLMSADASAGAPMTPVERGRSARDAARSHGGADARATRRRRAAHRSLDSLELPPEGWAQLDLLTRMRDERRRLGRAEAPLHRSIRLLAACVSGVEGREDSALLHGLSNRTSMAELEIAWEVANAAAARLVTGRAADLDEIARELMTRYDAAHLACPHVAELAAMMGDGRGAAWQRAAGRGPDRSAPAGPSLTRASSAHLRFLAVAIASLRGERVPPPVA